MEFPMALLGVALGAVLTPQLSAAQAKGDGARYSDMLDWGLRMVLLFGLPCAAALLLFADPLVAVLYHRKAFVASDVMQTGRAVMGWGVGLLGLLAVKVLAPGFYARQETRTPVRIAIAVLALTQLLNLAFVPLFGVAGLALSIGVGAMVNAFWLMRGLRKLGSYTPSPGWLKFSLKVFVASAALGALLQQLAWRIDWIALGATEGKRALAMAACLAAAALVYFSLLALMGLRLRQFMQRG